MSPTKATRRKQPAAKQAKRRSTKSKAKNLPRSKTPAKTGRPRVAVDLQQLEVLARIHCTYEEMAAVMGISEKTIQRRFDHLVKGWRLGGKTSLRRAQFTLALGSPAQYDEEGRQVRPAITPDRVMLIWLGKQELGQKDVARQEHTDGEGKPLPPTELTVEFVEPDGRRWGAGKSRDAD